MRLCGRPTRDGRPCKRSVALPYHFACPQHQDDRDCAYNEEYQRLDKFHYAQAAALRDQVAHLEREVRDLVAPALPQMRLRDADGNQIVSVEMSGGRRYAYVWRGSPPLAVGDKVLLPENWVSRAINGRGAFVSQVAGYGTTHTGTLSAVVRRA